MAGQKLTPTELEEILKVWVDEAKAQIEGRVYSETFIKEKGGNPPLSIDIQTSLETLLELQRVFTALRIQADLRRG